MATLSVQQITDSGVIPTFAAAASGGDKFANTGKEFLEVINATGSSRTVTITTPKTVDGLAVADRAVTVSGSSRKRIGPFLPKDLYNTSSGYVGFSYSAVSGVTVGVFKLSDS